MRLHHRVSRLDLVAAGTYRLCLVSGEILKIFICECYSFGVAEYFETINQLGRLDSVIINSYWCGYTPDAKRHCRREGVGLFTIRDFMAALNKPNFWMYLNEADTKHFQEMGWL